MALAKEIVRTGIRGRDEPRIAPPVPLRTLAEEYAAQAAELGIHLYPWQAHASRYITALDDEDGWLFREIVCVVARQNGKTELMMPRIRLGLLRGETILHTAQNRRLPRKTFLRLAAKSEFGWQVRRANGQEEVTTPEGGRYLLVAPNEGARGESADLVIIDEVREQHDQDLMDAILPTIVAKPNAQILYLSNAGDEESVVLNDLRRRGIEEAEPHLAYLEWSASPDHDLDDLDGWAEANPALGHGAVTLETLRYFRANRPQASFETENLCRWVQTIRERLVDEEAWLACQGEAGAVDRPVMAVSMDPNHERASAAIAWQGQDGITRLRVVYDVTGHPIDTDWLGEDLKRTVARLGIRRVAYDPLTDGELVKYLKNTEKIVGQAFANASSQFVDRVTAGKLRWDSAEAVTDDLVWTSRKEHDETGSFQAVRAKDDRPITASLAAIRAVWLASGPRSVSSGGIY